MRRLCALAALASAVFAVAACTGDGQRPGVVGQPTVSGSAPAPSGTAGATPTATPAPPDPAVTRQVCADAVRAAGEVVKLFNDQLAVLERAAARGDEATMVAAAEKIMDELTEMATTLRVYAQRSVTPPVRAALSKAAATLSEMASESYPGSPADIKKALTGLGSAFTSACA